MRNHSRVQHREVLSHLFLLQVSRHPGGKRFVQQRLIVFLGNGVIAIELRHLLLAKRDSVNLVAIAVDLRRDPPLFLSEALGLLVQDLKAQRG